MPKKLGLLGKVKSLIGSQIAPGITAGAPVEHARFPQLKELLEVPRTLTEVYKTLEHYGVFPTAEQVKTRAMGGVQRLINMRSPAAIAEELKNIIHGRAKAAVEMTRPTVQQYTTQKTIDGDMDKLLMWIGEDDARTCGRCLPRFGQIETYAVWAELGFPGEGVCEGGGRCRCDLVDAGDEAAQYFAEYMAERGAAIAEEREAFDVFDAAIAARDREQLEEW